MVKILSTRFSYSKLSTYKDCPFKYKLNYIDGNYVFVGSISTEFGTAMHEAEEEIAKTIQAKQPINYIDIKNKFIIKCVNLQKKYPKDFYINDGKSNRSYKDKMYEYLDSGIYRLEQFMSEHPTFEIVGVEQKFNFEYDNTHIFNGAIDRVFHDVDTDNYLIHDIKSWAVEAKEDELKTPLQFVIYTLAAEKLYNCNRDNISCEYDLPLVNLRQPGGTSGYINRGVKKINELFTSISEEDYKPKISCLCNYCNFCRTNPDAIEPYKYLCPYYSLWERTTRNKFDINKAENEWQGMEKHTEIYEQFLNKYNIVISKKEN